MDLEEKIEHTLDDINRYRRILPDAVEYKVFFAPLDTDQHTLLPEVYTIHKSGSLLWLDLGRYDYLEALNIQQEVLKRRINGQLHDDMIITFEPDESIITCGHSLGANKFPDTTQKIILDIARQENIEPYNNAGHLSQDLLQTISDKQSIRIGDTDIRFIFENRSGGATVLNSGERLFYLVKNISSRLHDTRPIPVQGAYKHMINATILDTLQPFIKDVEMRELNIFSPLYWNNKADIYVKGKGVDHKVSSKGVSVHKHPQGLFTSYGFMLYLNEEAVAHFEHVYACGLKHEECIVTPLANLIGKRVEDAQILESVKEAIKKNMAYEQIKEISLEYIR